MIREQARKPMSGYLMLLIIPALLAFFVFTLIQSGRNGYTTGLVLSAILIIIALILLAGFFMVHPNEAKVLQLFGKYVGTAREPGLRWANPFYAKKAVSTRIRNFESGQLKVNDSYGSPVEIAAVVVWKVVDTAEAVFEVDDFSEFVHIQSEAALRNLTSTHPYEPHGDEVVALRSHPVQIADDLRDEIQARLDKAGVEVIEARISHLAYAQEIAHAMLRRQQASAIIAARTEIVKGAVGMVQMALENLKSEGVIDLDDERKASMISNLLVVLCSEEHAQPVVNAGSLYS